MHNLTLLLGRVALSLIFVVSGIGKLSTYHDTAALLAAHGVAPGLLPLVIAVELGGGLAVLTGLLTRWAAAVLLIYTLLAALLFHSHFAEPGQSMQFMKNIAIAGGFLLLAANGAGALSIDALRRRRKQKIFY